MVKPVGAFLQLLFANAPKTEMDVYPNDFVFMWFKLIICSR
jgi:hypothetical protein